MATLRNDDCLLVGRSNVDYKVSYQELVGSLKGDIDIPVVDLDPYARLDGANFTGFLSAPDIEVRQDKNYTKITPYRIEFKSDDRSTWWEFGEEGIYYYYLSDPEDDDSASWTVEINKDGLNCPKVIAGELWGYDVALGGKDATIAIGFKELDDNSGWVSAFVFKDKDFVTKKSERANIVQEN